MASFSVYEQPDGTWGWRILGEGRRHVVCVNPGYDTPCEAATGAIAILGGALQAMAVRLAASYAERKT